MANETLLRKYPNIEALALEGGEVELLASDDPAGTVAIDPEQEATATEDRPARKLTLKGYCGQVAVSMWGHIEVSAEGGQLSGTLVDGHVTAEGIDLRCELAKETPQERRPVPSFVMGLAIDAFGVFVFTAFYVLVFAVGSKLIRFDPLSHWWLSLEVVLGAGTYFGYSGHSIAAVVLAVLAVAVEMYCRTFGKEEMAGLRDWVAMWDIIKLGIFFGIMLMGKMLRDYVESYRRAGWSGLRNRLGR